MPSKGAQTQSDSIVKPQMEVFLWAGPESNVDVQIRRFGPLRKGWWFRSYIYHEREGWIKLYKVSPGLVADLRVACAVCGSKEPCHGIHETESKRE